MNRKGMKSVSKTCNKNGKDDAMKELVTASRNDKLDFSHSVTDNESKQKFKRRDNNEDPSSVSGLTKTDYLQTCADEFYKNTTSITELPHIPDTSYCRSYVEKGKIEGDSKQDQLSENIGLFSALLKKQKKTGEPLSEEDRLEKIERCLSSGADINAVDKNNNDNTVLHLAVMNSWTRIAEFCLKNSKINTKITNKDGKTARQLAQDFNKDIFQLFPKYDQLKDSFKRKVEDNIHDIVAKKAKVRTRENSVVAKTPDNSQKTRYTSTTDAEPNSIDSEENKYDKDGSEKSLHGIVYQLKLLMLFLKRALQKKKKDQDHDYEFIEFYLGTEVKDANKGDDIVLKCRNITNEVCSVQAKHKQNASKKITTDMLIGNSKKNDFELLKYFISYRKFKKMLRSDTYTLKDFILCTNINFDFEDLGKAFIMAGESEKSDILEITKLGECRKLEKINNHLYESKTHVLYEKLREASSLWMLAKDLSSHILNGTKLKAGSDIFEHYCGVLNEKILVMGQAKGKAKFHDDFVEGKNLSVEVSNFRRLLQLALNRLNKEEDYDFKQVLHTGLKVSKKFGPVFELQSDPNVNDLKKFVEKFVKFISDAENDIIKITRHSPVIRENIDKLAGHILVQHEVDVVQFREIFFDDNNQLSGNLGEFKNELKAELKNKNIDFNNLKKYKYRIADFKTCAEKEGELLISKPTLPNDKIEDKEIEDFLFGKLVFAVGQPNEVELGRIIEEEMGEDSQFNLLNADLVTDSFQRKMLDWFKAKEGVWLNRKKGQDFLNQIEKDMNSLISIGLGLAYTEKLQAYGIKFVKNDILLYLEDFLSTDQTSYKILHLLPQEEITLFSAIKITDALEKLKQKEGFMQYQKHDSYIFMRLCTLLQPRTQTCAMSSFNSRSGHNLCVIDCASSTTQSEIQDLYENLSVNLPNSEKKIIIIAKKEHTLVKKFENRSYYYLREMKSSDFHDLTPESKETLLKQKVLFQGQTVGLNELIDEKTLKELIKETTREIIDRGTLIKLIKKEIIIGSAVEGLGEVNDYYIQRRVKPAIILDKQKLDKYLEKRGNRSDLFVISGIKCGLENHSNIYVYDNVESARSKFNKLCGKNAQFNIHWLNSDKNKLIWYKSNGSISDLIQCKIKTMEIDNTEPSSLESVLEDNHKIVIISDIAGMGKSIALTILSKKLKKTNFKLWVIKIKLNSHTTALLEELEYRKSSNHKFFEDKDRTTHFLLNKLLALQEQATLETNLFKNCINSSGKVALLFDGFDEISPDYKDIVIDLIQSLSKEFKVEKLFLTTRPNMCAELERTLGVFAYVFVQLSRSEQIEFMTRLWTKHLKLKNVDQKCKERLEIYAGSLIDQISDSINVKKHDFTAVPLHTRIIAEVFQDGEEGIVPQWQTCKEFLESEDHKPKLIKNVTLLDLYENFSKKKFYKLYLKEKDGIDISKVGRRKKADDAYKELKTNYSILALHTLLSKEESIELLSQEEIQTLERIIEDTARTEHRAGIVDQIINNKAQFIHPTFAEYFASFSVANKILEKPASTFNCIENLLANTSPIFIDNIIEQLNGKQEIITKALNKPLLHFITEKKHLNFIKSLLQSDYNDWVVKLDSHCKTPLHYACEDSNYDIIEELLNYSNDIGAEDILKHGNFVRPEFEKSRLVTFINIKDSFSKTALHYAIEGENTDLAFELLLKGASIDSLTDTQVDTLINVMLNGDRSTYSDYVDYLDGCESRLYNGGILAVYANQDNKYRPIQEKLLLKKPDKFQQLSLKDQCRILSYFLRHGRIEVIDALLRTINSPVERREILNTLDNGITPLDRVLDNDQLNDNCRLEMINYLLNHDINVNITEILMAAARDGNIITFKRFIAQETCYNYHLHLFKALKCNQPNIIKYFCENPKTLFNMDENGNNALHTVCWGDATLKIIKFIIDSGIDIDAQNENGETPLIMAIYAQSEKVVVSMNAIEYLVNRGADVNHEDIFHKTPLSYALNSNQVDIIKYLLKKNAHISNEENSQLIQYKFAFYTDSTFNLDLDENGDSRLYTAIHSNDLELFEFLVRCGADINRTDKQGNTPLHWASQQNRTKMVELLLQYGAFFDKPNNDDKTPKDLCRDEKIYWILDVLNKLFNSKNLMETWNVKLLKKCSNLCDWGPYGYGHADAWDGDNPMLFIINVRNTLRRSLLHIAANMKDTMAIDTLLKFNRDYCIRKEEYEKFEFPRYKDYQSILVDTEDSQGNTPLHIAAKEGHGNVVSVLLTNGAIFNSENVHGETPEILATNNNHRNIVTLLKPTKNLFIAIKESNKSDVENCIKEKAYRNAKNQDGKTPLHLAASLRQHNVLQSLLLHDADIKALDRDKNTPLHIAAGEDRIENVELLLKYGAIYNAKNAKDENPLDLACSQNQNGSCKHLLKQIDTLFEKICSDNPQVIIDDLKNMIQDCNNVAISTIINSRDIQGNSLLHYAVKSNEFDIVKMLLENGSIFNAQNKWAKTPKSYIHNGDINTLLETIETMFQDVSYIDKGKKTVSMKIITNVCNQEGKGLIHYAAESGNKNVVEFLIEEGADVTLKDRYGKTASDFAKELLEFEILDILQKHAAGRDCISDDIKSSVLEPPTGSTSVPDCGTDVDSSSESGSEHSSTNSECRTKPVTLNTLHDIMYQNKQSEESIVEMTQQSNDHLWLTDQDIRKIASEAPEYKDMFTVQAISTDIEYETSDRGLVVVPDVSNEHSGDALIKQIEQFIKMACERGRGTRTFIINQGSNHWTTLVIYYENEKYFTYYNDSSGSEIPSNILNIKSSISSNIFGNLMNLKVHQQKDQYNCGLWALENARDMNTMLRKKLDLNWLLSQLKPERLGRSNEQYFINKRKELGI